MSDITSLIGSLAGHWGPTGLLVIVVLLVLRGHLVPRTILDDARNDRDLWRKTAEENTGSLAEIEGQIGRLLEYAAASDHVIRSLPQPRPEVEKS